MVTGQNYVLIKTNITRVQRKQTETFCLAEMSSVGYILCFHIELSEKLLLISTIVYFYV